MESIIAAAITGVLALIGVIISNNQANKKTEAQLDKNQAITDTKLEALTREVREHNDFAKRIPVIEEQIKATNRRIDGLEKKEKERRS